MQFFMKKINYYIEKEWGKNIRDIIITTEFFDFSFTNTRKF